MLKQVGWTLALMTIGCSGGVVDSNVNGTSASSLAAKIPLLPWAGGSGAQSPWGGGDATRWRPEAVMANAMSRALNDAWAQPDVKDAIAAAPVKMLDSGFREFGDGQANAAPSFEWWPESRPPLVATLVRFGNAPARVVLRFDHALPYGGTQFEARWTVSDVPRTATLTAVTDAAGDKVITWTPPAEIGWDAAPIFSTVVLVHPAGWGDWFPVWFRFPVRPIADFKATVPAGLARFADGGDIADHEKVSVQGNFTGQSPFDKLIPHDFGGRYNNPPFQPADIHALFPWNGHSYVTGVGTGWTWVANQPPAPFKIMYTCFDRRHADAEAAAPDGGVPSGGGWHRIGDPAETVLNDLEDGPIALGSAQNNPLPAALLPSGGFAYNLSDLATLRFVQPGEAFITASGTSWVDATGKTWDQSNYHWYFFQQDRPVCTEEWVHPYRPTAALDFANPTRTVSFQIDGATTTWGQSVFVVGSTAELGRWDYHKGVMLAPTSYPTWSGTAQLPTGTVQLKFVKGDDKGNVVWESGADHTLTISGDTTLHVRWQ
jgi:hypothetical protein